MGKSWKNKPYVSVGVTAFIVVAALMVFYRIITDLTGVGAFFSKLASVLLPFIVGLALAYLFAPFYDLIQKNSHKLYVGKKEQPSRLAKTASKITATIATVLLLVLIVGGLLSMVIPQAYQSVANLIMTFPDKSNAVLDWVNKVAEQFGQGEQIGEWISQGVSWASSTLISWAQSDLLPNIGDIAKEVSTGLVSVIGTLTNVFIGVIICIYTLNSKDLFASQAKKVTYSLFKVPTANYIVNMTRYIDQTFGKFINGMLIDSAVLGVLCFIGMSLMGMPYALLVSVIVGVFNVVPIFGPIVAAVIGTFFVLLENPVKALIFLVFVLVMQQIDGNVIAPKILGDQTGLSGFWVIFAIVVGGGLFGLMGMLLGVPTFAVIYALTEQFVGHRLQDKRIPDDTESFNGLLEIDEDTGEMRYGEVSENIEIPDYEDEDAHPERQLKFEFKKETEEQK